VEVCIHTLLTLTLHGGERSASHPGRFTPGVRFPGTHWKEGRVGPGARIDAVAKGKKNIIVPARNCTPVGPARSLVPVLTELPQF